MPQRRQTPEALEAPRVLAAGGTEGNASLITFASASQQFGVANSLLEPIYAWRSAKSRLRLLSSGSSLESAIASESKQTQA